jgi:hypothetical protein
MENADSRHPPPPGRSECLVGFLLRRPRFDWMRILEGGEDS